MAEKLYDMKPYLDKIEEVIAKGPYSDDWNSLAGREMPQWLQDAKFGIFIHWGPYCVPEFNNEWYSRNMYKQDMPEFEHHVKTYGPHKDFGYKDFIPMFKAEKFDPAEWASIFKQSGAKYCIPVAEHHDGFQMYKSEISHWNSFEMGPKRDVLGELHAELKKEGLVCGLSSHRVEHWFFMGGGRQFDSDVKDPMQRGDFYWPAMPEAELHDVHSEPLPTEEFLQDWLVRCCELVDNYRPAEFYFDWWIQHVSVKPYLRKFAAYYYNRAAEWGMDVTICYKHDAMPFGTGTVDMERGKFADVKPFNWQTDTAIARNSWCWTKGNVFKNPKGLVGDLVDAVSKNGVMLLNVGPKPDGTISEEDKAVLLGIGEWLKVNGEAIYDTCPWRVVAEGPTKTKEGMFTDGEDDVFTSEDFRFTSRGANIYATALEWPENGEVSIKSFGGEKLATGGVYLGIIKAVEILGFNGKVEYKHDENGLHVKAPALQSNMPVVIKIITD